MTAVEHELVSGHRPPRTFQPTHQPIKDQCLSLFRLGWPVTSPQASSIRPPTGAVLKFLSYKD